MKCPYLNELVHFNWQGIRHLKFKNDRVERLPQDQYMRFKLLHLAPQVIKMSRTVQGILHAQIFERERSRGKTVSVMRKATFYEFIAVLDGVRIKIIVRRIGEGQLIFWSLIPYWGIGRHEQRKLHSGNPIED